METMKILGDWIKVCAKPLVPPSFHAESGGEPRQMRFSTPLQPPTPPHTHRAPPFSADLGHPPSSPPVCLGKLSHPKNINFKSNLQAGR